MIKLPQSYIILLVLCLVICLGRLVIQFFHGVNESEIDQLLEENNLGEFKSLFRECGITTVKSCGSVDESRVAEMPADEEMKVRRAAEILQQKLILKQWLMSNHLVNAYVRIVSLDVWTLEDVYWIEDSVTRQVLEPGDFPIWSAARQTLPISTEHLQILKTDLWSAVIKNSRHHEAWAWGGMLVVSASIAGLVTLAALTQPALTLAPEARSSLLHYVTGRYLHPPSCKVEFCWKEPGVVGETLSLKVLCYQRDGKAYPVSDADRLLVTLTHRATDRSLGGVVSLLQGASNEARAYIRSQLAGDYDLNITIGVGMGAGPVCGSPFVIRLVSSHVSAALSRVNPATIPHAAHRYATLYVLARDQFDNPATVTDDVLQKFKITFTPLDGETDQSLGSSATFTHDSVNERVVVTVYFADPCVYTARVYYDDQIIANGEFDCIVLTPSDASEVIRCLNSGRPRLKIRAYELPPTETEATPHARRVTARLTTRSLSIQSYWLNVIPQPPQIYPLTHYTKLVLEADTDLPPGAVGGQFSLSDGGGCWRRLWSPQRDVLAATLQALRQHNDAHSFAKKQEDLYSSLRTNTNTSSRFLRGARARSQRRVCLRVTRTELLDSSLQAVTKLREHHWRTPFHITFEGEQGVDWGGLSREWFSLICRQLFAPETGLFHSYKENGLVLPRPHTQTPFKLKVFEVAGLVVGKCVLESSRGLRSTAPLRLARSLLALLQGAPVTYKHFEHDDPELYMTKIKYILESDLEAESTDLYFTDEEYTPEDGTIVKTHELVPNGSSIRVTNANKLVYLRGLARWRLCERAGESTRAFLRGAHALLPPHALTPFTDTQLELVVCGSGKVSVCEWRAHSSHGGVCTRLASWFWSALYSFSHDERAKLLQFTTGSTHLPPNGFQDLNPRFHITPSPSFNALPTAHTCFNQLCLPDYESYEHLLKALLTAINEGEGFGLI